MELTMPLPFVQEPQETRRFLNSPEATASSGSMPSPRDVALRHGGDLVPPLYQVWKEQLTAGGLSWNDLTSAAAENRDAWRAWADGERTWRSALNDFVELLNRRADATFSLAEPKIPRS